MGKSKNNMVNGYILTRFIKSHIREYDLTVAEFCEIVGMSREYYERIMVRERTDITEPIVGSIILLCGGEEFVDALVATPDPSDHDDNRWNIANVCREDQEWISKSIYKEIRKKAPTELLKMKPMITKYFNVRTKIHNEYENFKSGVIADMLKSNFPSFCTTEIDTVQTAMVREKIVEMIRDHRFIMPTIPVVDPKKEQSRSIYHSYLGTASQYYETDGLTGRKDYPHYNFGDIDGYTPTLPVESFSDMDWRSYQDRRDARMYFDRLEDEILYGKSTKRRKAHHTYDDDYFIERGRH